MGSQQDGAEEFRRYWLEAHALLARTSLTGLRRYEINIVTGTLEGQPFVSGLAELYWDTREAFMRDITSPAGQRVLADVRNFASEGGPLLADEHRVISLQFLARIRRFFQVLWAEISRIPEYHDQAERLTRTLRRNHRLF
ncbi:MAG: EthD family reductase [Candidatus Methylomirabilaceae bacterium]